MKDRHTQPIGSSPECSKSAETAEIAAKFTRSTRHRQIRCFFLIILTAVVLCGAVCLAINYSIWSQTHERILTEENAAEMDAECILVLGAGLRADGSPSPILRERLQTGIALYHAKAAPKLLMSGDHGRKEYNEVGTMKKFAIEAGIHSADIFMDHAGFSTYESLYRAKEIFRAERVLIVTQKYHLYRALYIAKSLGIEAWGVAADTEVLYGQTTREIREAAARVKDFFWCMFTPVPTYLGDAIPVSGNGDLTND